MTKSGAFDAENLWITSQRTALPSLSRRSIAEPLLTELSDHVRRFPEVLRRSVQLIVPATAKRTLLAIGQYGQIRGHRSLNIRGLFSANGFEVYDPNDALDAKLARPSTRRSIEKDRSDQYIQARMGLLIAQCCTAGDIAFVIGSSDNFAATSAQTVLENSAMLVSTICFESNSGKFMRQTKDLKKAYHERFHINHMEKNAVYSAYFRQCGHVDPQHKVWQATSVERKAISTAIYRLLPRERKHRENAAQRMPQMYEFKGWIEGWLKNFDNYNVMMGLPRIPWDRKAADDIYQVLIKEQIIRETKSPEARRGQLVDFVNLEDATKLVVDAIEQIDRSQEMYAIDNHIL